MTTQALARLTVRNWKFNLKCTAVHAEATQKIIPDRYMDFVRYRRGGDRRALIDTAEMNFSPLPEDAGLAVFAGDIKLAHRTSIDHISWSKIRTVILMDLKMEKVHLHLDEEKIVKEKKVKKEEKPEAEVKVEPPVEPKVESKVESKVEPLPANPPPIIDKPVSKVDEKAVKEIAKVTRSNINAAREDRKPVVNPVTELLAKVSITTRKNFAFGE